MAKVEFKDKEINTKKPHLSRINLNKIPSEIFKNLHWNSIKLTQIPVRVLNKIPLDKIPLNTMPLKKISGLLNSVFTKRDLKKGEKFINYIKIYTHLINAYDLLNKNTYKRAFDHLVIVNNLAKEFSYKGEKSYIQHIGRISKGILKKRKSIVRRLNKYSASDPAHSKTNLLLAQNICIIRMLKINQ